MAATGFAINDTLMPRPTRFESFAPRLATGEALNGGEQVSTREKGWRFLLVYGGTITLDSTLASLLTLRNSGAGPYTLTFVDGGLRTYSVNWKSEPGPSVRSGGNRAAIEVELTEAP